MIKKNTLLAPMLACLFATAHAETLNVEGLPIRRGNSIEETQTALGTTAQPNIYMGKTVPQTGPVASAAPVRKPAPDSNFTHWQNSAILKTYVAIANELRPMFRQDPDLQETLAHIDTFGFSADTRKMLADVAGNDNPLHIKSTTQHNGARDLAITMDALHFTDPKTDESGYMSELSGNVTFDKSLRKAHVVGSLPILRFEIGKTMQMTANDLSVVSDQARGPSDLWIGPADIKLGQFALEDGTSKLHLVCDDIAVKSSVKPHGKLLDMAYDSTIKSIHLGNDELSHAHFAFRFLNLTATDVVAMEEKSKALQQTTPNSAERLLMSKSMLRNFGAALQHGGVYEIDDLSVSYHGTTGGLNGRITLNNAAESDLDSFDLLMKKLNLRINLHIPRIWFDEVGNLIASQTPNVPNKTGAPAGVPANAAMKNVFTQELDEFEKKKWISIERGNILSTIEFKDGKLTFNGISAGLTSRPAFTPVPTPSQVPTHPPAAKP